MSQDPKGFAAGDTNLYRYVANSPTLATDSTGLDITPKPPPNTPSLIDILWWWYGGPDPFPAPGIAPLPPVAKKPPLIVVPPPGQAQRPVPAPTFPIEGVPGPYPPPTGLVNPFGPIGGGPYWHYGPDGTPIIVVQPYEPGTAPTMVGTSPKPGQRKKISIIPPLGLSSKVSKHQISHRATGVPSIPR